MEKRRKIVITVFVMVLMIVSLSPAKIARAAGGSSSLALSSSSVNIDENVNVTLSIKTDVYAAFRMAVTYDASILEYTGASPSGDCNGGGGKLSVASEVNGSYSIKISFKAKNAGTSSISATTVEALAIETAQAISIADSNISVTVKNEAASGGGGGTDPGDSNPGDGTTETKSADNSLKSLTISPGTLSPQFKYSTTKYTASVDESVTSIAVVAEPSHEKASVVSVTGNTNLKVGENTVEITVKAENGTTAVYKIIVTRGGTAAEDPEEPDDETTNTPTEGTSSKNIVIDGIAYKLSATLPEEQLPREFIKTTATYNKQKVEAYTFHFQELLLLYLKPVSSKSGATSGFYFYNETADEFFPYINIAVGQTYAVILPNTYAETLPAGYEEVELDIEEYSVTACQAITEDSETENDFYLVYGVDKDGNTGWYQYDSVDMSLQRFNEVENVAGETQAELSAYKEGYAELQDKYNKERLSSRKVIAVLIVVLVIAIFSIINILLFKSGKFSKKKDDRDDDMDYVDLDEM